MKDKEAAFNLCSMKLGEYRINGKIFNLRGPRVKSIINNTALPVPLMIGGEVIGTVTDLCIYTGVSMEPHLRVRGDIAEKNSVLLEKAPFAMPAMRMGGRVAKFTHFILTDTPMEPIDEK